MVKTLTTAAAMLLLIGTLAFASEDKLTTETGKSAIGAAAEVNFASLPDFSPADAKAYREPPEPRNPYYTEAEVRAMKKAAITAAPISRPEDGAKDFGAPKNLQIGETPGNFINFAGSNEAQSCSGLTPSDMGLAVSGAWVVQVTNACVQITNKHGALLVEKTLDAVLNWPAGTFTFDPRVTFDFVKSRFIISASTIDSNGTAWIDVAASATNNPNGTWHVYHLSVPSGTTVADYPTLGQSWANDKYNGAIFICFNQFTSSGFTSDYCYYLPKKQIYSGAGFSFFFNFNFTFNGVLLSTIQPVNVSQLDEQPRAEYAVTTFNTNNSANGLIIWSFANVVDNTGTPGPYVTGIKVATPSSYNYPADADNATFCSNCIETLDNRISAMVQYMGGRMYPSIDTANGGTSAVLGWVVRPFLNDNGGNCTGAFTDACAGVTGATVETEFCDYCGAGSLAGWFGSVAADEEGNWTMFANFSDTSVSPGTFYDSNRVSWQTPFHDAGIFACQNNGAYTQTRWGDYTAAAPDYNNSNGTPQSTAIWGSGMYVLSNGDWGTCIAANKYGSVEIP